MGRDRRRQDEQRKKGRVKKMIRDTWFRSSDLADDKRFVGKMASTPHPCSCSMCCNPRRNSKGRGRLTLQEKRGICDDETDIEQEI